MAKEERSAHVPQLLLAPAATANNNSIAGRLLHPSPFFLLFISLFTLLCMLHLSGLSPADPPPSLPCSTTHPPPAPPPVSHSPPPSSDGRFWTQPDGMGYRPCLGFSREYGRAGRAVAAERRRFLMVVVSGGVNQQRNQIVDAVVQVVQTKTKG